MRKSIVETMALLVRKNGYEKTNIRDISEYLNIPRSLIYYYFKNKDDIMHVLYYERFSMTEQLAEEVLPRGEEPLVRLMLKYLLYRRNVICDPLFAEYIATAPEYASRGKEFSKDQIVLYYGDSRDAFAYFGKPTDGNEFYIHAFYPAEKFDLFNISPELWMMFVGPMVLSVLVDQTSVQRAASAKTEATAFWGHLLSCIPLFLFGWLMVYIGMWSGAEFPDAGGNAFIVMLMNKVSPIVCAVMICAILAAIMSTASGALVATDALVVHDLYCGFINKNATEEQQKRLNLIVNIVVSVAAVVCALAFTNVIDLLSVGYTIMLSGTLVPLLGGIIWKRGTTKGAAASAAVGMITALLSIFGVITVPFSSIFPVLPGVVAYIVVSLCIRNRRQQNWAEIGC